MHVLTYRLKSTQPVTNSHTGKTSICHFFMHLYLSKQSMTNYCLVSALWHVKNIYEVDFFLSYCVAQMCRNIARPKNHEVTGLLFSVEWIEDEQHGLISVAFSQRTGLFTVNNIYEVDFFVLIYGANWEECNKNDRSWGYGLTFFSRVDWRWAVKPVFKCMFSKHKLVCCE